MEAKTAPSLASYPECQNEKNPMSSLLLLFFNIFIINQFYSSPLNDYY